MQTLYEMRFIVMYSSCEDLFNGLVSEKPKFLDAIKIKHKNIHVNVYGVLHALSGGLNQEYVKAVNNTIEADKKNGLKILSEKSMKKMYKGIDVEVEDWLQMSLKESFVLGVKIMWFPNFINILSCFIKEKMTTKDSFDLRNPNIKDIGGSMAFHCLTPSTRRELAGFLSPELYLKRNIERKKNPLKYPGVKFPSKGWKWLTTAEPYVNIPLRSIHMIEYACEYARVNNLKEVSLFVGEIHNSDIDWYVNEFKKDSVQDKFSKEDLNVIEETIKKAFIPFEKNECLYKHKLSYLIKTLSGTTILIWLYMAILIVVLTNI